MALNIKNLEVEQLATEVATLAHESKTEAIRVALSERAARLKLHKDGLSKGERIRKALAEFRAAFPEAEYGRGVTKEEEEEILGFGPDGF